MECSKCGQKYRSCRFLPSFFCKCGGIFLAPRIKKEVGPDDPAVIAYRKQFEHYVDNSGKPSAWNRWTGSIYQGHVIRETTKAIHINIPEHEPKWIPKSIIDLEFAGDGKVDVWIPDWLMALSKEELIEFLESPEDWHVPDEWMPKSL